MCIANLKFAADKSNFSFARDTTAVLVAGVEFAEASREYPIVFIRGQDQQMRPVALLGVRDAENLFVGEQGKWDAHYIPAFVRRYPFVMAEGGAQGQLVVCIDEGCPALNADHGELLINAEGKMEPRMNEGSSCKISSRNLHAQKCLPNNSTNSICLCNKAHGLTLIPAKPSSSMTST